MKRTRYDVAVVGAGPNGLSAAAVLSLSGLSVVVLERAAEIGGGCRTQPLTLPGYAHDVCSAIHPMGVVSPVFQALRLDACGLEWVPAPVPLAHPLDDGRAVILHRDLARTAEELGRDGRRWMDLLRPFVAERDAFFADILRPLRWPAHPWLMSRFGRIALHSCEWLARRFDEPPARALLAGNAAHSFVPLTAAGSASFGLVLAIAGQAVDWPSARGGSARITDAIAVRARAAGCEIVTGVEIRSLAEVPSARAVLFDLTPRQLLSIAGPALSPRYRTQLERFRYGPGAFKIDYALSEPIPWRDARCGGAATVHLGGRYESIADAEATVNAGRVPDAPFVLAAEQSRFDPSRAPTGGHTAWAYCHVPNGCPIDMTDRIERQIERFAPGFREIVVARHVFSPALLESHNPNLVGGDIGGGANTLSQFVFRPALQWNPYVTSDPRLFLCSSSTPPGGGVHGMCGYWAARTVLHRVFQRVLPPDLVV